MYEAASPHTSASTVPGMVQYVYREVGIALPRVAQNQYDAGPAVPPGLSRRAR
jgi:cell wall-associated NlpC family hydrolase